MASKGFLMSVILIGVMLIGLVWSSEAYVFYVGGANGWVINPSENYTIWAGRNRFQVNDTLIFKYKKGTDSVLIVNKEDYDKCNTNNPIEKMDDGDSTLKFDRSGPYYFISGNQGSCEKGQKLFLVVISVRSAKPTTPSSSPPQSPNLAPQPSISPARPTTPSSSPPQSANLAPQPSISPARPTTPSSSPPQSANLAPQPSLSPSFAPNNDGNNSTAPSPSSDSSPSKYSISLVSIIVPAVSLLASWSLWLI